MRTCIFHDGTFQPRWHDGGSPPSGSSAPSLASQGRISSSSRLCACARRAASAASAVQRRVSAAIAAARAHGTRSRAPARTSRRSSATCLAIEVSANIQAEHHQAASRLPAWLELGVGAELARFGLLQGQCRSRLSSARGSLFRWTGLTSVVSIAICAPLQSGRPFATTSILRPSVAGASIG